MCGHIDIQALILLLEGGGNEARWQSTLICWINCLIRAFPVSCNTGEWVGANYGSAIIIFMMKNVGTPYNILPEEVKLPTARNKAGMR